MYHPGKVIEVFRPKDKGILSADNYTQATCEMWDENILTFLVAKKIEGKIKPGQYVLVSYRPEQKYNPPIPEHVIIKILPEKQAQKIWEKYKEMYNSRKRKAQQQNEQSYIA
ncbi:MAG: hypothetical protein N3D10_00035 [Candidatus Micrarchaeota archaeon]|nr:hypothetical protein [Candidatus Micrarchaeota archaeon]